MEVFWIAGAVAVIAWTQAKEEISREFREWLQRKSETAQSLLTRKVAYMMTCEFCFSFWVSLLSLIVFRHRVAYDDWRGIILAQFLTWAIANVYLTAFSMIRIDIRKDQIEIRKGESKPGRDHGDGDGHVRRIEPTLKR